MGPFPRGHSSRDIDPAILQNGGGAAQPPVGPQRPNPAESFAGRLDMVPEQIESLPPGIRNALMAWFPYDPKEITDAADQFVYTHDLVDLTKLLHEACPAIGSIDQEALKKVRQAIGSRWEQEFSNSNVIHSLDTNNCDEALRKKQLTAAIENHVKSQWTWWPRRVFEKMPISPALSNLIQATVILAPLIALTGPVGLVAALQIFPKIFQEFVSIEWDKHKADLLITFKTEKHGTITLPLKVIVRVIQDYNKNQKDPKMKVSLRNNDISVQQTADGIAQALQQADQELKEIARGIAERLRAEQAGGAALQSPLTTCGQAAQLGGVAAATAPIAVASP